MKKKHGKKEDKARKACSPHESYRCGALSKTETEKHGPLKNKNSGGNEIVRDTYVEIPGLKEPALSGLTTLTHRAGKVGPVPGRWARRVLRLVKLSWWVGFSLLAGTSFNSKRLRD